MLRPRHVLATAWLLLPVVAVSTKDVAPAATKAVGWEATLAPPGEPGEPFVLEGRVTASHGSRPLRDVLVYVYHADAQGRYYDHADASRARLAGELRTNVLGGYRVRTVLPGLAEGIPHVHLLLAGPGLDYRAITLTLCRRHGAGSDTAFARLPQMLEFPSTGSWAYVDRGIDGAFHCRWDLPFDQAMRLNARPREFSQPAH